MVQRGRPDNDSLQVRDLIVLYDVDLAQNLGYDTSNSKLNNMISTEFSTDSAGYETVAMGAASLAMLTIMIIIYSDH